MAAFQREEFERLCLQLKEGKVSDVCLSNLRYGTLTEEMLEELFNISSTVRKLQFNVPLSKSMLLKLASWIKDGKTSLEYLGMEYCNEDAMDFFRTAGHVRVKTIQFSFSTNFALDNISEVVVRDFFAKSALTHIRFAVSEELGLWGARQQVSLLECLVTGLAESSTVESLDLKVVNGADLSEDCMEMLFHLNECLRTISITAYEQLMEPFLTDFLTALRSSCLSRDITLKNLSIEASVALFDGLASAIMIKSLTIEILEYGSKGLEQLSNGLSKNSTIRKLVLIAVSGGIHTTLNALAPMLSNHATLQSFQILGHDALLSRDVCPMVETILESNPRLIEFGFPIYTAKDAKDLLSLIPRLQFLQSLQIVDGSFAVPLIDPDELLEALGRNSNLISYCFFSPKKDHNVRLRAILQRNIQLRRRRAVSRAIPQLEKSPQLWPLVQSEMSNRDDWLDATYHFTRELLMLQR
jgi:hypothetical protein